jgi:uncharacterized protein DUF6526
MAEQPPQNFQNHRRWVPAYHFVAAPILLINVIWTLVRLVRFPSGDTVMGLLVAFAIFVTWLYARFFPLTVQNRVIRLEMTLRMEKLLPPDLKARIKEFTLGQLIALRFAVDEELPGLAKTVLQQNITSGTEIKKMIKNWNPDYLRA